MVICQVREAIKGIEHRAMERAMNKEQENKGTTK